MGDISRSDAAFSPTESDVSFIVTRHGGLAHVEPTSLRTEAWLFNYASKEATWDCSALVIEMRFFADFVEAALAEGHRFEAGSQSSQVDCPRLAKVEFDNTHVHFVIEDGSRKSAPLAWYPRLAQTKPNQLNEYQIGVDGLSVRWPILDEELHLEGVMRGARSPEFIRNL
jgi:hypothetical protein